MIFELSDELKLFQKTAQDFADKEVLPLLDEAEKNEEFPRELFRKTGELHYLCPSYPTEYGGGGMGKLGESVWVEQMARISRGLAGGLMVQSGLSTSMILKYGSKSQVENYFKPAVRGEKVGAFGLTESGAGSDAASIATEAKKDGDNYIINGSKSYITNGNICDYALLAVNTDKSLGPKGGISVIIVDKSTPGFTQVKMKKMGTRSAPTGELHFDNCVVPAQNLLGEEGKGFRYLMEGLSGGRISHSAGSLGIAQACLEASISYANQREQFGQPIGRFQATAFKISHMATEIEAARWFLYRVAWLFDQKRECRKEAAMTKLFSSEVAITASRSAMEIHAGSGYMSDSPVQRYYRDAILTRTTEGTNEVQQIVIARELGL